MRLEVVSKVSRLLDKIKENRAVKDATEGILQEEKKVNMKNGEKMNII